MICLELFPLTYVVGRRTQLKMWWFFGGLKADWKFRCCFTVFRGVGASCLLGEFCVDTCGSTAEGMHSMITLEWKRYKNLISHSRDLEDFRCFYFLVDMLYIYVFPFLQSLSFVEGNVLLSINCKYSKNPILICSILVGNFASEIWGVFSTRSQWLRKKHPVLLPGIHQ